MHSVRTRIRLALLLALLACAAPAYAQTGGATPTPAQAVSGHTPLDGDVMWIWQLKKSSRGSVRAIVRRARANGIEVLAIKGADSRKRWRQLSPRLVSRLKAAGLRVCGWHFVYGRRPRGEADVSARVARTGVDCLLIDAEGSYEGRYAQAQIYMNRLRGRVGPSFPIGLTSFPYVHFHPGFPYSVFLAPGNADFNSPQMYWRAIGTSVDRVFTNTYKHNAIYRRPLATFGGVWQHPPRRQIRRFRQLATAYGSRSVGWWDWQHAARRDWRALASVIPPFVGAAPNPGTPRVRPGSRGDEVVWLQQHLLSADPSVVVDGRFGSATQAAVARFQSSRGLEASGQVGPITWQQILSLPLARVSWTRAHGRAVIARAGRFTGPRSASLPAVRNEIGHRPH